MAQYGHNWYGTSYYGRTNAFCGYYQTKEIFTDEALEGPVDVQLKVKLPSATYNPFSPEIIKSASHWQEDVALNKIYSTNSSASLTFTVTADHLTIFYEKRTIAAKVKIKVETKDVSGTVTTTNRTLNTQSSSVDANASYEISGLTYGSQKVTITFESDSPANAAFNFKGVVARTANLTLESRARTTFNPAQPMADSDYAKVELATTHVSGDEYLLTGQTLDYTSMKYVQFKVYLASSDNETSPEVEHILLTSGDVTTRTKDGWFTAVLDMAQIASEAGASFKAVERVSWNETVPATGKITIRSQSSERDTIADWENEKVTVPYKQGTKRVRLKEGFNQGWIDVPVIQPLKNTKHTRVTQWLSWDDQSFLPPDGVDTKVIYRFLNTQRDNVTKPYSLITNPMNITDRTLITHDNLQKVESFSIRIHLTRGRGKQTPVVDWIKINSSIEYKQDVSVEDTSISAVDFNNQGKGAVKNLGTQLFADNFQIPVYGEAPIYELIDDTGRPQDVSIFLESEMNTPIRTNKTTSLMTSVWAETKTKETKTQNGLVKFYQYGGGQVSYPFKEEIQMSPTFTGIEPMNTSKIYKYYLLSGWPQQNHFVGNNEKLEEIAELNETTVVELEALNPRISYNQDGTLLMGQSILLPNTSSNGNVNLYWKSTNTSITAKSSQNAVNKRLQNLESDSVTAEIRNGSIYGYVDWVSEEKIYDGVINPNDMRSEYKRTHLYPENGSSSEINYTVLQDDTFAKLATLFGVYEADIRHLNDRPNGEPVVGETMLIPSRITLPEILPEAVVTDNPYHIEIVYNSVKKKNGKVLPSSSIIIKPLDITYKTVIREEDVVRGQIENGKDLLGSPRVKSILSVRSQNGMIAYNPWDEALQVGNYKLEGNFVSWSPEGVEPNAGDTYTVRYTCEIPNEVTVFLDTTYVEEGGVDYMWRSPEVKEFKGICYPGEDFVKELPPLSEWMGVSTTIAQDLEYTVEDNDIWVKTWTEKKNGKDYIIGSLQDRIPKENWHPTAKTGYYYIGKDEFYLFSEPVTIEPTDKQIPVAENVDFLKGKYDNAIYLEGYSENLLKNTELTNLDSNKKTIFKMTF